MGVFGRKPMPASDELPKGDPFSYAAGRSEWDDRIMDAGTASRSWRSQALMLGGLLALSIASNWWQASTNKIVPYIIERDSAGNPIPHRIEEDAEPSDRDVQAAAMRWVRGFRTVYVDGAALRRSIEDLYKLTELGSPARNDLNAYFRTNDPFNRARMETVTIPRMAALPMGTGRDPTGLRTVQVDWDELTTQRDDNAVPVKTTHVLAITWRHTPPKDEAEIEANPDGVYVVDFKWRSS